MESLLQLYLDDGELIREYTEILIGKRKTVASFYSEGKVMPKEKVAVVVLKYAIEKLLHWSPDTAMDWLNRSVIKQLKLESFIKMISFPSDLDPKADYWYAVYKVYPDIIPVDVRSLTIRVYEQVLRGKREKFPLHFFDGIDGQYRAAICLNHAVQKELEFKNLNEYYSFFADSKGETFVRDMHLAGVCKETFSDVLEFAHHALHPDQRNEFLYNFQRFCQNGNMFIDNSKNILKSEESDSGADEGNDGE